jgi:hypothetical protein
MNNIFKFNFVKISSFTYFFYLFLPIFTYFFNVFFRPWRLFTTEEMDLLNKTNSAATDMHYFEVDFPELFAYKLPALNAVEAVGHCGEYLCMFDMQN